MPESQERLAALFAVFGAAMVFGPAVWILERWLDAIARDPASAWGARWLGESLSGHPYLMGGALLFIMVLVGGLVMLGLVTVAKRLAARLAGRAGNGQSGAR